jgi:hypothetical protein
MEYFASLKSVNLVQYFRFETDYEHPTLGSKKMHHLDKQTIYQDNFDS